MRKVIIVSMVAVMMLALSACGGKAEPVPSVSAEPEALTMPGIPGSQAYDIIISMDNAGIPKVDAQTIDGGFTWNQATTEYSYSITANKDHEVGYAEFFDLTDDGEDYLSFCASMPYDTSDTETAKSWVVENIGSEAETTIGDAVFKLSEGESGSILSIECIGYAEYLDEILFG